MRRLAFLLTLAIGLPAGVHAEATDEKGHLFPDYTIDSTTSAGYRSVDVDGSTDKYREDYNIRAGGRLFRFDLNGRSQSPDKTPLDRFHLEVDTPGDEPVSRFRLSAADRGRYDLRANFIRSKYFYDVPQLFEAPVAGDDRTDDLHDWNFTRTNGTVDLTVDTPGPTLLFGYRLYRRNGNSVSTVRIPYGDTFLVSAPIDTATHVGLAGTKFRALDTDVFLQQEYRRVNRDIRSDGPLPGEAAGLDPSDTSRLDFYSNDQNEHIDIPATTVRLRRAVGDAVELTGAYFYSHADLTSDGQRLRTGTSDSPAFSGSNTRSDSSDATLDTHVADTAATIALGERVRLHTSYRFNERSLDGHLDQTGTLGPFVARTGDHVRRHGVTSDVEFDARDDLTMSAGVHYDRRDANLSASGQDVSTDTVGAVGGIRYRPWRFLDLFARYENVQVDDPLSVPGDSIGGTAIPARETTFTFVNRGTTGLRLTPWDWVEVAYRLTADSRENDTFDGRVRHFDNTVSLTLVPLPELTFFASYTRRDLDYVADILIAPLYASTTSLQQGTEDVFVSELRYDFGVLGQRWSSGWNVVYVNSESALRPRLEGDGRPRTFYDLDRIDGGAFLTLHHWLVDPTFQFRLIDYNEGVLPANDYRATIIGFVLTRRFDF